MWAVLTYIYNFILIIFIATHLIVGAIISFLSGLYIGVYLCQNYELPKISEPSKLWGKFGIFMEQYRKKPSASKFDILKPSTILSIVKADDDKEGNDEDEAKQSDFQRVSSKTMEDYTSQTQIMTDSEYPDFGDFDSFERYSQNSSLSSSPPSQILEASLIISQDPMSSLKHSKYD